MGPAVGSFEVLRSLNLLMYGGNCNSIVTIGYNNHVRSKQGINIYLSLFHDFLDDGAIDVLHLIDFFNRPTNISVIS